MGKEYTYCGVCEVEIILGEETDCVKCGCPTCPECEGGIDENDDLWCTICWDDPANDEEGK